MLFSAAKGFDQSSDPILEGSRAGLLKGIPLSASAFVIAMILDPLSGHSTPFDLIIYPTMLIGMVITMSILYFIKTSTNFVMLSTLASSSLFFVAKLVYILFYGPPGVSILGEMTESFFWVPSIYLLSQYTNLPGYTRIAPICLIVAFVVVSGIYIVQEMLLGSPNYSVISALVQMNMAQMSLLAASYILMGFKSRFIQIETHATTMHQIAHTDQLTGLANRLGVQTNLEQTLTQHPTVGLIFLDLDGFKAVNDTLGSGVGDEVLREVARRWTAFCRDGDSLGRWSGDEFVTILGGVGGNEASAIAQRLIDALTEPINLGEHVVQLTASAGVSSFPEDGAGGHELIRHAESALSTTKRAGKNSVRRFTPAIEGEIEERQQLERDLRVALERNEFELAYQPIVDLKSGETIKAEALLRWKHPTRGMVSPATFIPIAESSGLIVSLGNWILLQACMQAKIWNQPGRQAIRIAVNISAVQLGHPEFLNVVAQTLAKTGLPARLLELELTEGTVLRDISEVQRTLGELRELGVSLAIDDFGTGYSSLSYLRDLPIQTIKIDRSFINDLGTTRFGPQFALALIEAILSIARTLNLEVVAEGIEEESQLVVLRSLGCNHGQGYLFARPEPGQALEHRLQNATSGVSVMAGLN
jgi:diguanylate cyclase